MEKRQKLLDRLFESISKGSSGQTEINSISNLLFSQRTTQTITKELLVGKTISFYDSFNGHGEYIVIESVFDDGKNLILKGKNYWCKNSKLTFPLAGLAPIVNTGNYTEAETIDHCYVEKRYKIV